MSSDAAGVVAGEVSSTDGLIPKLRFPEFSGTEAWGVRRLGSLVSFSSGGTPAKENPAYWGGDIPWVSASSMYNVLLSEADHYVTPLAIGNGTSLAKKGAILILVRGSMLFKRVPICLAEVDVAFNQDVKALNVSPSLAPSFILNQLLAVQCRIPIQVTGMGAGKIESDHLVGLDLPIPNIAEQQKIADCLSSIDAVIAAERERLVALREHKKGLMQALFPTEGQTNPRFRFPEFRDAGEWVERPLSELLACPPAYGANAGAVPYDTQLPTYLRITDISDEGRFVDAGKMSVDLVADDFNTMQGGDIALTRTGASVGKSYLHADANGPLVFAGFLIRVRPDQQRALPQIIFQYMQTQRYWSWVARVSGRSGQPGINSTEYGSLPIPLPPGAPGEALKEQQLIADCFSSLDLLAAAIANGIDTLKAHKSGLMQQLFPSPAQPPA